MDIQSTLTDFLAYLYENNIDIRDENYDWQVITKKFIDKSGCANLTKAELKRAKKMIDNTKLRMTRGVYTHTDARGVRWYH